MPLAIIRTIPLIRFYDKRLAINDNEKRLTELSTNNHDQQYLEEFPGMTSTELDTRVNLDLPKKRISPIRRFFEA